ncbi:MAG: ABC-F family ATP-binding cassette domain-containing protein [Anaerolineae bacterium]|nr:ABC-F family ATP-binding cassette domain-containing protein [Anaerolineae bacterium]
MTLVSAHDLARSFGANDIFEGISVSIPHDARIALVGPNGSGKTTLLNLLAKSDTPTEGTVTYARGLTIGFLPQESSFSIAGTHTLFEEMLTAFADLLEQESRLNKLADQLAQLPDDETLLEAYGKAQESFELNGGYEYTTRIGQVLGGLGFDETDFDRPVEQLSGGQKTRALLARLLLENPNLLILDEPTNHLDIQAIEWLERWLKTYEGALLLVSHDRYFMDSVVDHVWELIFGKIETYRGSYSHYIQQRGERHAHLLTEYRHQQEFIAKEQEYIQRNIAGQNTRQAQGRRKRLERYLRDEAITRPREQHTMRIDLQSRRRSGDEVLITRSLVIGYHDDKIPLFEVPDITLYRGECAALIGPNGAGKTTFIKTILNQLKPLEGKSRLGASVEIGYFAQAHEMLDPQRTVLAELLVEKNIPVGEARNYLAQFLFTGDDIDKPVAALSGGERGRLALARLALRGANLLLLDEPTNHLDIPSQEILETVLANFQGTILLVSHDRYLIRRLATQIWALDIPHSSTDGKTRLIVYEGPYSDYISERDGNAAAQEQAPAKKPSQKSKRQASAEDRQNTLSPYHRKKRLVFVEGEINRLEVELVNLSGALESASAAGDVDEVARLGEAYSQAESDLDTLMLEWEALAADI